MTRLRIPLLSSRRRWSAVVLVAATIFYGSVLVVPGEAPRNALGPSWDALVHAFAYATLALVLAYATADWRAAGPWRPVAVLVAAVGYGGGIELAQATVFYRQFAVGDLVANAAGVLLVLGWFALETRLSYRRVDREGRRLRSSAHRPGREE